MKTEEQEPEIDYFYNEKGDYTITHYGNPIAIAPDEESAIKIKNSFSSIKMRVDVLSKVAETTAAERDKLKNQVDVLAQDCTYMESERDSLKAGKNALEFAHIELIRERDKLKEEVERLNKSIEFQRRCIASRDNCIIGKDALLSKLKEENERLTTDLKHDGNIISKLNGTIMQLRDINKSLVEALELVDKRLNLHLHPEGTIGYDVYNKVKAAISQAKAL